MRFFGMKATKAFAIGVVLSGLVVGCNEASQVAKIAAPEAEAVNASTGKGVQSAQLTAEERETKKREFFAKPEVKEMSAGLEEIAEAVAVAVEDKELRERIYAKCMEKFDGETNVLWQQLESDGDVRSKGGWNKRIDDHLNNGRKNATVKGIGSVDAAIKKFEKLVNAPLHLFWMYPSQWDKKTTPLIAFLPFDADPKTRQSIPAFDAKGNRFELDRRGELAKKRPVIVLTLNERTELGGKLRSNLFSQTSLTSNSKTIAQNGSLLPKGSPTLQSNVGFSRNISLKSANINRANWSDPDGEWEGSQEFYYLFECGDSFYNTNVWLGKNTNNLGWTNQLYDPNSQGNISLVNHIFQAYWGFTGQIIVKFTYYEADGLWWDDKIEMHEITKSYIPESSYPYYVFPNSSKVNATYQLH
jgi:hypothetical protein